MKPKSPSEFRAERAKKLAAFTASEPKRVASGATPFKMATFPGVDALEGSLLLAERYTPLESFTKQIDEVSLAAFAITCKATQFVYPADYYEEGTPRSRILTLQAQRRKHESQFKADQMETDEERAQYLLSLGIDFTRDGRVPLHCTWWLCRQAEAAAQGLFDATMPNSGVLSVGQFSDKLAAEAAVWMRSKRSG